MHPCRWAALAAGGVALTLAVAGCGTTVQTGPTVGGAPQAGALGAPEGVDPGAAGGDGALGVPGSGDGAPPPGVDAGGAGGTGSTGGAGSPGDTGSSGGTGGTGTDGTGGPGGAGDGGPDLGGGAEDGTIEVGLPYTANGEAANSAIGAGAITTGDQQANLKALVAEINETGGVGGLKIKPVYFAYDAQSAQTVSQQDQSACAQYTEDNDIAILLGGGLTETLDTCMRENDVLVIGSGSLIGDAQDYQARFPNIIDAGSLSQDRMYADQATALERLGYHSGWNPTLGQPGTGAPVLGILTIDDDNFTKPLRSVYLPALRKQGYSVDARNIYAVREPGGTNELAGTVADVQNATLRFRQSGVTHLMMFDANGILTILFAQNANAQRYYPRIAMTSTTGAQAVHDTGVITNQQLNGAVGTGWLPSIDLTARAGSAYQTRSTVRCLEIMKRRTGQTYSSTNAASLALSTCDTFFLMRQALDNVTGGLSLATAISSVEALRGTFVPALLPQAFFGPGRHDAVQAGFDMKWDTSCSCTRYVGEHQIR